MSLSLYLIRHGETKWAVTGQHTGLTDLPLTENGKSQAEALKKRLCQIDFTQVFASPLLRASETCRLCGYQPTIDRDLVEWNYGKYEGLTTSQIREETPQWNLFLNGAPGGEKPEDVGKRVDQFLLKVKKLSGNIAVFSSAHLLRVLTARFLALSAAEGRCFFLAPASLSILTYEHGTPVISLWNDISHLGYK